MRITTWAEYGLIVTLHLARRKGGAPIAARSLAEEERLPADYVEQILLKLRRAGLVNSARGAHGGYRLARDPAEVTVCDVVRAAEDHTFEINCDVRPIDAVRCAPAGGCVIRPVWQAVQRRVDDLLQRISLADLLSDAAAVEDLVMPTVRH